MDRLTGPSAIALGVVERGGGVGNPVLTWGNCPAPPRGEGCGPLPCAPTRGAPDVGRLLRPQRLPFSVPGSSSPRARRLGGLRGKVGRVSSGSSGVVSRRPLVCAARRRTVFGETAAGTGGARAQGFARTWLTTSDVLGRSAHACKAREQSRTRNVSLLHNPRRVILPSPFLCDLP